MYLCLSMSKINQNNLADELADITNGEKKLHANIAYMLKEANAVEADAPIAIVKPLAINELPLEPYLALLSPKALELQQTRLMTTVHEYFKTEDDFNLPAKDVEYGLNRAGNGPEYRYRGVPFSEAFGDSTLTRCATLVFYLTAKVSREGAPVEIAKEHKLFVQLYDKVVKLGLLDFGSLMPISRMELAPYHKTTLRLLTAMSDGTFRNTVFGRDRVLWEEVGATKAREEYDAIRDEVVQIEDVVFQEALLTFVALSEKANAITSIDNKEQPGWDKNPITTLNNHVGVEVFSEEGALIKEFDWDKVEKLISQ